MSKRNRIVHFYIEQQPNKDFGIEVYRRYQPRAEDGARYVMHDYTIRSPDTVKRVNEVIRNEYADIIRMELGEHGGFNLDVDLTLVSLGGL